MIVPGTPSNDLLYGTDEPDQITAQGGDDKLFAFGGNDALDGGDGSDLLDGGTGADTMTGGLGNDYYYVDDLGDLVAEDVGAGADLVFTSINYALPTNVERLVAIDPNSITPLTLTGNALNNEISGNAGPNILVGNGGFDTLRGLGGDDVYIVKGKAFVDEHAGGGYDIIYFDAPPTRYDRHAGADYSLKEVLGGDRNQIEQLSIYDRSSTNSVNLVGSRQSDVLTGNDGINQLDGWGGVDTMYGYGGDDVYYISEAADLVIEDADQGYDTIVIGALDFTGLIAGGYTLPNNFERLLGHGVLNGNALDNEIVSFPDSFHNGADTLNGGDGNDKLTGNDGVDTFMFSSAPGAANADVMMDFQYRTDKISLDHTVFTGLNLGALSDSQFRSGADWQAQDADDRILYDISTGNLYFDPDGNGDQAPQLFATLFRPILLSASDFSVF